MKKIKEIEEARKKCTVKELGIDSTFFWAYVTTQKRNNKYFDFDEYVWEKEFDKVFDNLKRYGIRTFTISSTSTGLQDMLARFEEKGCKVSGLVKINGRKNFITNEPIQINAIKLKMPKY